MRGTLGASLAQFVVGQTLPLEQASAVLDAMDSYETLGFSVITGF